MPKDLFDAQVSFNLLPRFGDAAKASIEQNELRLEKHLVTLLGPLHVPLPSVKVVHAPVFHGYCAQVWLEFDARPSPADLEALLEQRGFDVRTSALDPPSNLSVAGHSGVTVGEICSDRTDARGLWLWAAADNLRLTVENALLVGGLAGRETPA
jgi:aspartate-semialdehyde dehydrogenase